MLAGEAYEEGYKEGYNVNIPTESVMPEPEEPTDISMEATHIPPNSCPVVNWAEGYLRGFRARVEALQAQDSSEKLLVKLNGFDEKFRNTSAFKRAFDLKKDDSNVSYLYTLKRETQKARPQPPASPTRMMVDNSSTALPFGAAETDGAGFPGRQSTLRQAKATTRCCRKSWDSFLRPRSLTMRSSTSRLGSKRC